MKTRLWVLACVVLAVPHLLQAAPPGNGATLPQYALARFGSGRVRDLPQGLASLSGAVGGLAFSPDGKVLVSGNSSNGLIRFWDAATGKETPWLHSVGYGVDAIAFSPDGKLLAAAGEGQLVFWEIDTGVARRFDIGKPSWHFVIAFSADSKLLAVGSDNGKQGIALWDVQKRKEKEPLAAARASGVAGLAFSPDGKTLAAYPLFEEHLRGTGEVWLRQVEDGEVLRRFGGGKESLFDGGGGPVLTFAPDGKRLVSIGGERGVALRVWDPTTGKEIDSIRDKARRVGAVTFAANGKVLAWLDDASQVHLWDPATSRELFVLKAPGKDVSALALSPDGKMLALGGSKGAVWTTSIATILDGTAPKKDAKGDAWPWSNLSGKDKAIERDALMGVRAAFFLPEGRILTAGDDGFFRIWDSSGSKMLDWFGEKNVDLLAVAMTPDGKLLASARAGDRPRLWDVSRGRPEPTLDGKNDPIDSLALSADGKWLAASGTDGKLRIWNTQTGALQVVGRDRLPRIDLLSFSLDGETLALGCADGVVRLWDVQKETVAWKLGKTDTRIRALAVSPDGRFVAWGSAPGNVQVCETATGKQVSRVRPETSSIYALCFSPDGRHLATGEANNTVRVLELASGSTLLRLEGHQGEATAFAFAPDGRALLSVGSDHQALLWDLTAPATVPQSSDLDLSDLIDLYNDLKSSDAERAYRATWTLADHPKESVPLLNHRLHLATPLAAGRLTRLVADLGDTEYLVQQKAAAELEEMGPAVVPFLRKTLAETSDLPVRSRLEEVLANVQTRTIDRRRLLIERALGVLERAATPQAREVLAKLAEGDPESWLTQEARAGSRRLAEHAKPKQKDR
jgi:WD40 repeat protein